MGILCTMFPPGSARDRSSIAKTWLRGLGKRPRHSSDSCAARILASSWCALRTPLHDSLVRTIRTAENLIWAIFRKIEPKLAMILKRKAVRKFSVRISDLSGPARGLHEEQRLTRSGLKPRFVASALPEATDPMSALFRIQDTDSVAEPVRGATRAVR